MHSTMVNNQVIKILRIQQSLPTYVAKLVYLASIE
ncbi:unnamed protein product [Spirodela intermedia]|uniref:Uncharacterized protein n=1 Tax=Spirodela intermedia TaxID=51605 RepID=A0A7I8IL86_SPIIN|nr:unnamed protein product [Spirodela intermedia]CAA6658691.1 unnamed protein product [Spirodela intermedia]